MHPEKLNRWVGVWADLTTREGVFTNGRIIMVVRPRSPHPSLQGESVVVWDNPAGQCIHNIVASDVVAITKAVGR